MVCTRYNYIWSATSKGNGEFNKAVKAQEGTFCKGPGYKLRWGDINGDKKADLVCFKKKSGDVVIWIGKGDGTFTDWGKIKDIKKFCR